MFFSIAALLSAMVAIPAIFIKTPTGVVIYFLASVANWSFLFLTLKRPMTYTRFGIKRFAKYCDFGYAAMDSDGAWNMFFYKPTYVTSGSGEGLPERWLCTTAGIKLPMTLPCVLFLGKAKDSLVEVKGYKPPEQIEELAEMQAKLKELHELDRVLGENHEV